MIRKILVLAGALALALTMSGTVLASSAPKSGHALTISPVSARGPLVLNNKPDTVPCYYMYLAGSSLSWNDPGLHNRIRIASSNTCYNPQLVAGGSADIFHINPNGANCAAMPWTSSGYIYDEACSTTNPDEQFVLYLAQYGYIICLKEYGGGEGGNCLAHALAVNANEPGYFVGDKQTGPNSWVPTCATSCSTPSLTPARWRQ
jgi:hypothetical protein